MVLLDTCTLLWIAADQKKLSLNAKRGIDKNAQSLFISAISAFEIAIKCQSKKLKLLVPPLDWYTEALHFHGILELPVTGCIVASSIQLPVLHNDPCDRIIIATAQLNTMKIITCDTLISQYQQAEIIW